MVDSFIICAKNLGEIQILPSLKFQVDGTYDDDNSTFSIT